jgi:hypothetical protein
MVKSKQNNVKLPSIDTTTQQKIEMYSFSQQKLVVLA